MSKINPAVNDPEVLEMLYWQEGLSMMQIADRLDVSEKTIYDRMRKFEIDRRGVGYNSARSKKDDGLYNKYANYHTSAYGYPLWQLSEIDNRNAAFVHQLTAIANGADPHKVYSDEYHTHHKNGVKWDNRDENLEVVDRSEHMRIHANRGDTAMGKGRYDQYSDIRFPDELREMADNIAENTTLSKRECDLLVGYADGFSRTELTDALNVSDQGIESTQNRINEKWAEAENTVEILSDLWG